MSNIKNAFPEFREKGDFEPMYGSLLGTYARCNNCSVFGSTLNPCLDTQINAP
jgi:hypothetical protein